MRSNTVNSTRRSYNRFVANEMMEDFALRFTAKRARRWPMSWVANTALGTVSFLVLEALGGVVTLSFGVTNALWAIAATVAIIILSGLPICYYAARDGVDIDLLTRGAGFGYIGSTITSLLYASFTFIFFALEAAIMAMALQLCLGLPLWVGYIASAVIVIPLVMHGISRIGRFQQWSQPLWLLLQLLAVWYVFSHPATAFDQWLAFAGIGENASEGFSLAGFGAATAILLTLVTQIGEQVDFLRFLPPRKADNSKRWWLALALGGPGWIIPGALKLLLGSFLAYLAINAGLSPQLAGDPAHMYQVVFSYFTDNTSVVLFMVVLFVGLSQLKINLANAYAGSLAWSNFFSRLTHSHPGRVVWVVFNVAIALMLMLLGIYHAIEATLQIYSVLVLAWIGSLVADLLINKPLGFSPNKIEFKRSRLYDLNPVGLGSMLFASLIGLLGHMHYLGDTVAALASLLAFALPFITAPLLAWLTQGRYYLAPDPSPIVKTQQACGICELEFEAEDMSYCPAYQQPVCSLCCSLELRCNNHCRQSATWREQLKASIAWTGPVWSRRLSSPLSQVLLLWGSVAMVMGLIFTLAFSLMPATSRADSAVVTAVISAFCMLTLLMGVLSWLFILARAGSRQAMQEAQQQSALLGEEVDAHQQTYSELQQAKDKAESANHAKTRYLAGISHELRTPLNVLMGYAQLLSNDKELSTNKREQATTIRRNGEQLVDLIEGLLEISKIEAGRLELQRDEFALADFLQQLVAVFQAQALDKKIEFDFILSDSLPHYVAADKQRLRQVLINLLSNAVKFTHSGKVCFSVYCRNDVSYFKVEDSGVGMNSADIERIFKPFERVRNEQTRSVKGTGLGLAISQALAEIMGGQIQVSSQLGQGSEFTLKLMLSEVRYHHQPEHSFNAADIIAYEGDRRTILVVDDEAEQRCLMRDLLSPLGFDVLVADGGEAALAYISKQSIDLFLMDVSMPGMNGWQLAIALRKQGVTVPILMVSANSTETEHEGMLGHYHNDFMTKPVELSALLEKIGRLLELHWTVAKPDVEDDALPVFDAEQQDLRLPSHEELQELKSWAEIGYLSAFSDKLQSLVEQEKIGHVHQKALQNKLKQCDFAAIIQYLDTITHE